MKLMTLITAVLLIGSQAFAGIAMDCGDRETFSSLNAEDLTQSRSWMNLSHNFSSATLYCSSRADTAVERGETFRCAGMWAFDLRRPDNTTGTVAIAEFSKKEDSSWTASFTTTHDYGRLNITMPCEIKKTED